MLQGCIELSQTTPIVLTAGSRHKPILILAAYLKGHDIPLQLWSTFDRYLTQSLRPRKPNSNLTLARSLGLATRLFESLWIILKLKSKQPYLCLEFAACQAKAQNASAIPRGLVHEGLHKEYTQYVPELGFP